MTGCTKDANYYSIFNGVKKYAFIDAYRLKISRNSGKIRVVELKAHRNKNQVQLADNNLNILRLVNQK